MLAWSGFEERRCGGGSFLFLEDEPMPIAVECSGCGGKFRGPDESAGKRVKCPKCSAVIEVNGGHTQEFPASKAYDVTIYAIARDVDLKRRVAWIGGSIGFLECGQGGIVPVVKAGGQWYFRNRRKVATAVALSCILATLLIAWQVTFDATDSPHEAQVRMAVSLLFGGVLGALLGGLYAAFLRKMKRL